ncbi:MAG: zinc ribbon domain-containing protein [Chloroflexota bacterium]|nr:zinc ribbon domain-containing protein [Chloroflexota bacterium]
MPIYEYRCNACHKKVSIYVRNPSAPSSPTCPSCGGEDLTRLLSTFTVRGTYRDIYEDILSDNQLTSGLMRNDPKALAEWNRRMTKGMEEVDVPPEYEDALDKMDHGIMPETPIGGDPSGGAGSGDKTE